MSDTIKLDVGGKIFKTTRSTLSRSEYFNALFARWTVSDEPYFIDRSGKLFAHVLEYLRNPGYECPPECFVELDFYCIKYKQDEPDNIKDLYTEIKDTEKMLLDLKSKYNITKLTRKICLHVGCPNTAIKNFSYCYKCSNHTTVSTGNFNLNDGDLVEYDNKIYYYQKIDPFAYLYIFHDQVGTPKLAFKCVHVNEIKGPAYEIIDVSYKF